MSAPDVFHPNSTECPSCKTRWDIVGDVYITGLVQPEDDLLRQAKIGIAIGCPGCDLDFEVWLPLNTFQQMQSADDGSEVCDGN
jgi:hypothetical protein